MVWSWFVIIKDRNGVLAISGPVALLEGLCQVILIGLMGACWHDFLYLLLVITVIIIFPKVFKLLLLTGVLGVTSSLPFNTRPTLVDIKYLSPL